MAVMYLVVNHDSIYTYLWLNSAWKCMASKDEGCLLSHTNDFMFKF